MITSASNPTLKRVRALQAQRRAREQARSFVVEGVRLAEEAAQAQAPIELVLHTEDLDPRGRAALAQLRALGARVHAISPRVMALASDTQTPAGILAIVPWPAPAAATVTFALVLDRLSDPGNLGTILRTAVAAGVDAVFLAPGTVDVYSPKAVRAAMGAHFHVPLVLADWDVLAERLAGLEVWLAEARGGQSYDRVDWRRPCALVIGSEAEGPSDAARRLPHRLVHIPMPGKAESLNAAVAAGVLMFEAARQRN